MGGSSPCIVRAVDRISCPISLIEPNTVSSVMHEGYAVPSDRTSGSVVHGAS